MTKTAKVLTREEVLHVAKLASLTLTEEEVTKLQKQLGKIIDLVSELQSVKTDDVKETSQVTGSQNVWREDQIDSARVLSQEQVLSGAKRSHNGFFVVDNILE